MPEVRPDRLIDRSLRARLTGDGLVSEDLLRMCGGGWRVKDVSAE